ncbi:hypothetical protein [Nocardioides hwasunensis]|uniref:Ferredoxin n=1 Tax=Nocardioides hwasunensis TaxID=397258 RepID=A0ABR8MDB9_9ACTN|nr:hypothetical protein [Nocardioides hwasunensis]MBD3914120.1 hypothetical protein [Nocardioides hwasunensis]
MYDDYDTCSVCGSAVRLLPNPGASADPSDGPGGPRDGFVGAGDDPVDVRECTNEDCPTRKVDGPNA